MSVPYTAFKLTLLSPQMKEASWISSVYDSFSAKFHQDEEEGGGHDEHQQNARKVDTACTHMRTELYVRMRDSFSQPAGGM